MRTKKITLRKHSFINQENKNHRTATYTSVLNRDKMVTVLSSFDNHSSTTLLIPYNLHKNF